MTSKRPTNPKTCHRCHAFDDGMLEDRTADSKPICIDCVMGDSNLAFGFVSVPGETKRRAAPLRRAVVIRRSEDECSVRTSMDELELKGTI